MLAVKWMSNHSCPPLDGPGIVIIRDGKNESIYAAVPIRADWGEGWELRKQVWDEHKGEANTSDVYHINLDGQQSTCDCMGFTQHRTCKHLKALLQLKEGSK